MVLNMCVDVLYAALLAYITALLQFITCSTRALASLVTGKIGRRAVQAWSGVQAGQYACDLFKGGVQMTQAPS